MWLNFDMKRLFYIIWMGPKSNTRQGLIGGSRKGHGHTHSKEGDVKTHLKRSRWCGQKPSNAKWCLRNGSSPESLQGMWLYWYLDFRLTGSRTVRVNVYCFNPLILWLFVTVASGNSYRRIWSCFLMALGLLTQDNATPLYRINSFSQHSGPPDSPLGRWRPVATYWVH